MRRWAGFGAAVLLATALTTGAASAASAATATAATTRVGYAGPARIRSGTTTATSRNWDGYATGTATDSTDFDGVRATWVQPTVQCEATDAWTVFWAGLDGWGSNSVEQGGSSARCGKKGAPPQYELWWEMWPTYAIQPVLAIDAGDTITASVTYSEQTAQFTITVRDVTSGRGFTRVKRCASGVTCARASAEAITEDVGHFDGSSYFPLADYGTMGYTGTHATDVNGHTGSISDPQWLHTAITEAANGKTYATVSPLTHHGTAFTTTWQHK